jgi:hypothetical protein
VRVERVDGAAPEVDEKADEARYHGHRDTHARVGALERLFVVEGGTRVATRRIALVARRELVRRRLALWHRKFSCRRRTAKFWCVRSVAAALGGGLAFYGI